MHRLLLPVVLSLLCVTSNAQDNLKPLTLTIDGVKREALIYAPESARTKASPLIFGWHGHGGNMRNSATSYHFHTLWPEAICVYAQGLNTPGRLTDPEGKKPGWQGKAGDMGDRDLKFFDALLTKLHADYKIDDKHVFSSGHSNGGGFTYLLWAERGDKFCAMAPSAAAAAQMKAEGVLKPKPVLHVAGENDPLVKFEWQKALIEQLKKINHTSEGKPWELDKNCTIYPSETGTPVITAIHPGTHTYPKEAPGVIIKFFKSQMK